jgi:hypothetical protein
VERSRPQVRPEFIAQAREAGDIDWLNLNYDEMASDKNCRRASRDCYALRHIPGVPR